MNTLGQVFETMRVAWWTLEDCAAAMRRLFDRERVGPAEPLPERVAYWVREECARRVELRRRMREASRGRMAATSERMRRRTL
jgi:predicted nucleic acid-binding Zn ribbon protein